MYSHAAVGKNDFGNKMFVLKITTKSLSKSGPKVFRFRCIIINYKYINVT